MIVDEVENSAVTPAEEATKEQAEMPLTPLGEALNRILAPLESQDAWPKRKPIPKHVDCKDLLKHPAFRCISPGG